MKESLFTKVAGVKDSPLDIALLFRTSPVILSGLLSDKILETIYKKGLYILDATSLGILKKELAFRKSENKTHRLSPLAKESPFCFPVVFKIKERNRGLFRPAAVSLYKIRAFRDKSFLGRKEFAGSSAKAIALADAMIPGTERPWISPVWPKLSEEADQSSAQLSFFFASICYLLGLVYPRRVICSSRLNNGSFVPVKGVAEKAKIAALDGFSFFVVAGKGNKREAEKGIKSARGKKVDCKVVALVENMEADKQFFDLVEQLIQLGGCWRRDSIEILIRFLFIQSQLAKTRSPELALEKAKRIKSLLAFLPKTGVDESSDSLKLSVIAKAGKLNLAHGDLLGAEKDFIELRKICRTLLNKRRCPANFENFWYGLPLYQGRIALERYQYKKARNYFTDAVLEAKGHWPPNLRFEGLCAQAMGRCYLREGQTRKDRAKDALHFFQMAHKQIDVKDKTANYRYVGQAHLLFGKFKQSVVNIRKAMDAPEPAKTEAAASLIRTLVIWGVMENRPVESKKAMALYDSDFEKNHPCSIRSGQNMAKAYKGLAVYHTQGHGPGIKALLESSLIKNKKQPTYDPSDILADLCLCYLGSRLDKKSLFSTSLENLERASSTFGNGRKNKIFTTKIARLEKSDGKTRLRLLRTMLTQIHHGVPAHFFATFIKNLLT